MKKKIWMTVTAAALILSLTACDSLKKDETSVNTAGTAGTIQTSSDAAASSSQNTGVQDTADQGQNLMGSADAGYQENGSDDEPSGTIIPDEDADAADNDAYEEENTQAAQDGWTGAYIGSEESVNISLLNETTISFAFAQSGISGTASVNGQQAVYNGDDSYVIVFNLSGTVLDISVSNEEDYDASESPLIGTYTKE